MSFPEILDTLFLKPLYLLFEIVYVMADKVTDSPGLSIIVLSLFMNFLVLPLYMRADKIQEEEREAERELQKGVEHIKKTFSGDERMMMLQTYYRQKHYKPVYVLRSAISIFLQIPFFIAAYRFLSGLQLLNGVSFGPIADLSMPDGILSIGGISINIMPIIMTVVNLVSCVIFTKDSSLKEKIQLYAMALFFLIFLYQSPAGLVFYWTLNNVFSLVKTIFYKLKQVKPNGCGLKNRAKDSIAPKRGSRKIFLTGALFLTILLGGLIPSAVIKASPLEFVDITYFYDPCWYIVSSFCMAFGIFVIWANIFYFLAKSSMRVYFDIAIWLLSGVAIVNYMFFGKDMGILLPQLIYAEAPHFTWGEYIGNMVAVTAAILIFAVIFHWRKRMVSEILAAGVLALSCMALFNLVQIRTSVETIKEQGYTGETPRLAMSGSGKNVIVIMLDRAMGEYIPFLFQEKPEFQEQFSGFTYYANTVSFGAHTNYGAPALFGGYEYTPAEMNKRDGESLASKHNEALRVMPVLFEQNGYEVTVCDPPYAGYQWIPDLSIYNEYPGIRSYITSGKFTDVSIKEQEIRDKKRNFLCYSVFKCAPLFMQDIIYDHGQYNSAERGTGAAYSAQERDGTLKSTGLNGSFMNGYNVLASLPHITDIIDDNRNTFLVMGNETTHEAMLLQEPDYVPAQDVDNTEYEREYRQEREAPDGNILKLETDHQVIQYQANMAALLQLGKWFDYMRANDVYDNTRIILVSDHGYNLGNWAEFRLGGGEDISAYYPLLMVKDFDSTGFMTSEEFMTNGDVPTLALKGIIEDPVNPFTGKIIDSGEKEAHDQYVNVSHDWSIEENNGNTFHPGDWYAVHDDMRNADNWELVAENAILPTGD